ncbi:MULTISPECIES: hypothetical protein [Asticcacaulis]|uniref:hypothetical protein n=1 Tax=Asticcacaulis TaxID=76890 RepID=UPI001AE64372|nr:MULTISPECIES: hypothetical protein [Asticcacaulis]MBP2159090.1 hypothetical protein [Asticcacaulis solisilvae]MDR6800135.1 hypothetical protein [Asticcacaulis sp. BE141]
MGHPHERFGLETLVELISAEQAQSPAGTPVGRVEERLKASIAIARGAGLDNLQIHLDRFDFAWLCNARGIDRLTSAANAMKIDVVPVRRAKPGMDSHMTGAFVDAREAGMLPFPLIGDPSMIPNFVQHIATAADKAAILERLQKAGRNVILAEMPEDGTVH